MLTPFLYRLQPPSSILVIIPCSTLSPFTARASGFGINGVLRSFLSSPTLFPLSYTTSLPLSLLSFSPTFSLLRLAHRTSLTTVSFSGIREREAKKKILESYGLDPSDFIDEQSPREEKKGEEAGKEGKGRQSRCSLKRRSRLVLGGKARRRKLLSPKGMDVRPMMEVVRGAAFDILQVASGCPASLRPGRWLDLYSGTGSVGIEAISRGCSEAHFVEMDPWIVSEVLRPNLEWTGFLDASVIHMNRVENFLEHVQQSRVKSRSFDYISVTPPYTAVDYSILMDQLAKSPLVGEDCFIVSYSSTFSFHLCI
uniref:rRNA methyltransferase YlbH n=1 Tax=Ananas comosus var. bracteatus TaxID=296719 RepID=A0A6V7PI75_ANACO|nr:unnamed protein product [Ananas comosus var. bracteatus]